MRYKYAVGDWGRLGSTQSTHLKRKGVRWSQGTVSLVSQPPCDVIRRKEEKSSLVGGPRSHSVSPFCASCPKRTRLDSRPTAGPMSTGRGRHQCLTSRPVGRPMIGPTAERILGGDHREHRHRRWCSIMTHNKAKDKRVTQPDDPRMGTSTHLHVHHRLTPDTGSLLRK